LSEIVRVYEGSHGIEYFISIEDVDENIYGFIRLRLAHNPGCDFLPELKYTALIRELHVYGEMTPVWFEKSTKHVQHKGIGSMLIKKAETIARNLGYGKIAIISGNGVKEYYRNRHMYVDDNTYVSKQLIVHNTKLVNKVCDLDIIDWKTIQWEKVKRMGHNIYVKPYDIDPTILMHPLDVLSSKLNQITTPIWIIIIGIIIIIMKRYF
jgi:GNAT superfamily N-acetyltransferase